MGWSGICRLAEAYGGVTRRSYFRQFTHTHTHTHTHTERERERE